MVLKKLSNLLVPLSPNLIAALHIITAFLIESIFDESNELRAIIYEYSLFIPFILPLPTIFLEDTSITLKKIIIVLLFYGLSFIIYSLLTKNFNIFFCITALSTGYTRILFNIKNKRIKYLTPLIPLCIISNILFSNIFFGSIFILIFSFYNCIIAAKNISGNFKKRSYIVLISSFGSVFGYGLLQSIDKSETLNNPIAFYLFICFSLLLSYFQNYFLFYNNKIKIKVQTRFMFLALLIVITIYIDLKLVYLFNSYLCMLIFSDTNAYFDRNKLIIKNIIWFIVGLFLFVSLKYSAEVKFIIVSSVYFVLFTIKHLDKNVQKNI